MNPDREYMDARSALTEARDARDLAIAAAAAANALATQAECALAHAQARYTAADRVLTTRAASTRAVA